MSAATAVQAASAAMDQDFPPNPVSAVLDCIMEAGSAAQAAIADAKAMADGITPPDPCAFLRKGVAKAQEEIGKAQAKAEEYRAKGEAEIASAEASYGSLADMASKEKADAVRKKVSQGQQAYDNAVKGAEKAQDLAQQALDKCEGMVAGATQAAHDEVDSAAGQASEAVADAQQTAENAIQDAPNQIGAFR